MASTDVDSLTSNNERVQIHSKDWLLSQSDDQEFQESMELRRIELGEDILSYEDIFVSYIWRNKPFMLTGNACCDLNGKKWKVFDKWLKYDQTEKKMVINKQHLESSYGDDKVPIAQCNQNKYDDHPKIVMTMREYLRDLLTFTGPHYLKDYHFVRHHPNDEIYQCPVYFQSDWLNEYCIDNGLDDYKFVYMGPKGTWTPFHADVLRSYSWSANVTGEKRWIIYYPGSEELLKDELGNLPFDVSVTPYCNSTHPAYKFRQDIIQHEGEIIFIPSGWHHQVHNLAMTLSINHNWFNGCNIHMCWHYLQSTLSKVEQEISDCQDMDNWHDHCQVLLKAYLGFNYDDFINILQHIANKRFSKKESFKHCRFDLNSILYTCQLVADDDNVINNHKQHELVLNLIEKIQNFVT